MFIIWLVIAGAIYFLYGSKLAAAMFIVAAFYCVFALISVYASGRQLKAVIKGDRSIDKNKKTDISVETHNESPIPVPSCRFNLTCENILTKEKQDIPMTYSFAPKGVSKGGLAITEKYCGRENISIRDAVITDPIGLFSRKQELSGDAALYVMPEIKGVDIPSEYLDSYDMESYSYSQHKKGNDTGEVFGIREYSDGDSPKQIHWKLSAKLDDLMVKIPSFPIENKLIVLLDNSIPDNIELTPAKRSGLVELFFSISSSLIKGNITHSVGWCDHKTGAFIVRRIESEADMWAVVPEALSAGIEQSRLSTAYRFLASSGEEHFTNHFVVTATEAAETERLAEYGEVRVFRIRAAKESTGVNNQGLNDKGNQAGETK